MERRRIAPSGVLELKYELAASVCVLGRRERGGGGLVRVLAHKMSEIKSRKSLFSPLVANVFQYVRDKPVHQVR